MIATACGCCGKEIKGRPAVDAALGEVCMSCVQPLINAMDSLNASGIVGLYRGTSGDNSPPKEEAP